MFKTCFMSDHSSGRGSAALQPWIVVIFFILSIAMGYPARTTVAWASDACGEVIGVETHDGTTTRYSIAHPKNIPADAQQVALVLLVGGGGILNLDERGCARALTGNSLVRSIPHFLDAGFVTVLVDAPSDHLGGDGLAGFRTEARHAEDLGHVIANVRARTKASIWLVGTSRGTISAVNAAARLSGASAPDGVVLTSALMAGQIGARKPWVADTVFDLPLESIRLSLLVIGHSADSCVRSPANLMSRIVERTKGSRQQVVTVEGGAGGAGKGGIEACEGKSPHGFVTQEAEVVAGIARFIRGGRF